MKAFNGLRSVGAILIERLGLEELNGFQALETAGSIEIQDSGEAPLLFPALRNVQVMRIATQSSVQGSIALPSLQSGGSLLFMGLGTVTTLDLGQAVTIGTLEVAYGEYLTRVVAPGMARVESDFTIIATLVSSFDDVPVLGAVGGRLTVKYNPDLLAPQLTGFLARVAVGGEVVVCGNGPDADIPTSCVEP